MRPPRYQTWPPLMVLTMGLAVGIGLARYEVVPQGLVGIFILLGFLFGSFAMLGWGAGLFDRLTKQRPTLIGLVLATLFIGFSLGLARSWLAERGGSARLSVVKNGIAGPQVLACLVTGDTVTRSGVRNMAVQVLHQPMGVDSSAEVNRPRRLLLRWQADASAPLCGYGDTLVVSGDLRAITLGQSPLGDGYQHYLSNQGYEATVWVKDWHQIRTYQPQANSLLANWWMYELRHWMVQNIIHAVREPKARGMVLGLALGMRQAIGAEDVQAFALSGTSHVLAVSGMHMMVLYGLLQTLLHVLRLGYRQRKWALGIAMIILWVYSLLSGMSPAAVRAATMTSFMLAGNWWQRDAPLLHSVSAAAAVLLIWDPAMLFQVSFQLSLAGCIGIGLWSKLWLRMWQPESPWLLALWELSCVTMAATLTTLPLTMYYFQQIPMLWIPANWVTGLVAGPLTIISILLALVGQVPFLSWVLSLGATALSAIMYAAVHTMGQPSMVWQLPTIQPWWVAVMVAGLLLWWQWWRFRWRLALFSSIILLMVTPFLWHLFVDKNQPAGLYVWRERSQTIALDVRADTVYWLGQQPNDYLLARVQKWTLNKPQKVVMPASWALPWKTAWGTWWVVTSRPPRGWKPNTTVPCEGIIVLRQGGWHAKQLFRTANWVQYQSGKPYRKTNAWNYQYRSGHQSNAQIPVSKAQSADTAAPHRPWLGTHYYHWPPS